MHNFHQREFEDNDAEETVFWTEGEVLESGQAKKTGPAMRLFKFTLKSFVFFAIFSFIGLAIFSSRTVSTSEKSDNWFYQLPVIKQIRHLAESAERTLKGEERDRVNILLLGMGGKNHDGGYLTDTIMLASLAPSNKKVSLLSIPRDLSVPMEGKGWRKVNNINAFAESTEPGQGGVAVSQALSNILKTPIDYYVRVDFDGFIKVIDILGGIDVYVENTLDDYKYPIRGREDDPSFDSRYEHLHIEKGWQKMDGSLALKYARSRHGLGVEGSDFARARRQQKIIEAVKNKVVSENLLFNPGKVSDIFDEVKNNVTTNLKIWEIVKLWQVFKDVEKENISNKVLSDAPGGLLTPSRGEGGAYILLPKSGDFSEIQYFTQNIFNEAPTEAKNKVHTEKATLDIRNGTWVNGLAGKKALDLEKYNFEIASVSNCSRQNFQKSVIYDLTFGEKIESLKVLKDKTGANVSFNLPQWLLDDISQENANKTNTKKPDFILILGQDADENASGLENQEF